MAHRIHVLPQKQLSIEHLVANPNLGPYVEGGKYVDDLFFDITGQWVHGAQLNIVANLTPIFLFDDIAAPPKPAQGSRVVQFNLIRRKVGWTWDSGTPRWANEIDNLISVEIGGKHRYALRLTSAVPVLLNRIERRTEPRLRPKAHVSDIVCSEESEFPLVMSLRGRLHLVYDSIELS